MIRDPALLSDLEAAFLTLWKQLGGPDPEASEYRFAAPLRRWRFDFAWPSILVAVEMEGGIYSRGRHVRGVGFTGDCEKYNLATSVGWSVFRVTDDMLTNDPEGYLRPILRTVAERLAA